MKTVKPLSEAAWHALMECNAGRVHRATHSATWYSRDDGQSEALNAATMRSLFSRGLIRAERFEQWPGGSQAVVTFAGHRVIEDRIARERKDPDVTYDKGPMRAAAETALRDHGQVPVVAVDRDGQQVTITLTGDAGGLFQVAQNLIEADRLSFHLLGEAIVAGYTAAAADTPDPDGEQLGACEGCSEPIYAGQPHGADPENPGDLWHVACRAEGSDDLV